MNVFSKVTLESLKKNRTRTIVTIIGIMLSAAMICASTTLVSSMQNFVLRCAIHIDGDWYGAVYDAAYTERISGRIRHHDIRNEESEKGQSHRRLEKRESVRRKRICTTMKQPHMGNST